MSIHAVPFPFPLDEETIRRRRTYIFMKLCAMDPEFCPIPVHSMSEKTCSALLNQYDALFLNGLLARELPQLHVTLSNRLTRAAGKFLCAQNRSKQIQSAEIRMSGDFLFRLTEGPFSLNGLTADTPQEAFLIVFEHELCHAVQLLLYGNTGHNTVFRELACGLFGHTSVYHALPTRKTQAAEVGLTVGRTVEFTYQGERLCGVLTYVGKRGTVMVRASDGPYRDARHRRYQKYYVPLKDLMPV